MPVLVLITGMSVFQILCHSLTQTIFEMTRFKRSCGTDYPLWQISRLNTGKENVRYSTCAQAVDLSMMFPFKSIVTTKHINAFSTSNYSAKKIKIKKKKIFHTVFTWDISFGWIWFIWQAENCSKLQVWKF